MGQICPKWIKIDQNGFLTCVESRGDSCKCGLFPKHDNQDYVESIALKLDARTVDSEKERVKGNKQFNLIVIQLDENEMFRNFSKKVSSKDNSS